MLKIDSCPAGKLLWILALALPAGLFAASPPALVDYQGVLRGATDEPLTGSYDMTFRFFDAPTGGNEILVDRHLAANTQAVTVDGGLFAVGLGGGVVTDGSGPGTYSSLGGLFHDQAGVWLEVQVGTETLAPRTRILSAGYALNATSAETADRLNGQSGAFYLDTSATRQIKPGAISFHAPTAGVAVVEAIADPGSPLAISATSSGATCKFGYGSVGSECYGTSYGGFFGDSTDGSYGYLGYGAYGTLSYGPSYGGVFSAASSGGIGLYASGGQAARFEQSTLPGTYVNVAWSGYGLWSRSYNGIQNWDHDDSTYARIGSSPYKIQGTGTVSFVQNRPGDPNEVVIYHAPESSEVNVYTRGSARLQDGSATISLDPTFAWTANPEIGLTAHLTPRGEAIALAIETVSSHELRVTGPKGSNVAFDYLVTGLRIGFEEIPPVQPKEFDSRIPEKAAGQKIYAKDPELRAFNALERHREMARSLLWVVDSDMKATRELRERIGIARSEELRNPSEASQPIQDASRVRPVVPNGGPEPSAEMQPATLAEVSGRDPRGDESARVAVGRRPGELFAATSMIQAGDVVVLDPIVPGAVKRCDGAGDRNLVGVAVGPDRDGKVEVAVAEIREVLADANLLPIAPGDFLTTSATKGAAMRAPTAEPGTILGKALEPLASGVGTIRVLLMPR